MQSVALSLSLSWKILRDLSKGNYISQNPLLSGDTVKTGSRGCTPPSSLLNKCLRNRKQGSRLSKLNRSFGRLSGDSLKARFAESLPLTFKALSANRCWKWSPNTVGGNYLIQCYSPTVQTCTLVTWPSSKVRGGWSVLPEEKLFHTMMGTSDIGAVCAHGPPLWRCLFLTVG